MVKGIILNDIVLIPLLCQFLELEFELTAEKANIGAAVGLVFG